MATTSGSLTASGIGLAFAPQPPKHHQGQGRLSLTVTGTFVATWRIVRRFNSASAYDTNAPSPWQPATNGGAAQTFTGAFSEVVLEPASGAQLAIEVTSFTSGQLNYRFDQ